jgi:SAM-dependent methyltransferase
MTLDDLRYFRTDEGEGLLREAQDLPGDELAKLTRLRKRFDAGRCRAAMTLLQARERGQRKFSRADEMVFDREGLEQASGEVISAYRAKRYEGKSRVADLCCGVGGDTIGLAGVTEVVSVDRDPARAGMTRWNSAVYDVGTRVETVVADATGWLPHVEALFMDPGRRSDGRRLLSLADYLPPVDLAHLREVTTEIGIKVAPGISYDEIPDGCEVEFISESGSCREAVLWFGGLRTAADRRATLLPVGKTLAARPSEPAPVRAPGAYVLEPDRAVIRAHLIDQLAGDLGAWKLDGEVAYLSSDSPVETPFATRFRVREVFRFGLKRLQGYLRVAGIGRLEIKKRRFPIEPDDLRRQLRLGGEGEATLVLTRIGEKPTVIVCDRVREGPVS